MKKEKLLKIYIDSEDKYNGKPLWKVILSKAKESGIAGATVLKAVAGIGSHSKIHTINLLSLSINIPLIIEIVDLEEKIEKFINILDEIVEEGLITVQDVEVKIYRHR
ncbi:DUF190 domain-containing protein [Desulfurobacterium atlanticum]|uniref:Uncharacterized protein n=1 Tax=Desulfurobacterium atlanticum TaxID=240169 RepID=A0A238XVN1_9BACT|nr:DUF190 domain-containing protein [Desulfurobacterium atlanticum]SNR62049.1 hypothetical protein SAMN06265340_101250 [Desulfurobacterium atlanticum]